MVWWVLAGLLTVGTGGEVVDPAYRAEIARWRQEREASLKADGGWLTVAGLFWLKPGANPAGSARLSAVRLPTGAPERLGEFLLEGSAVTFLPAVPGATLNGRPVADSGVEIHPYTGEGSDVIAFGDLQFLLLERGGRLGIRLKDNHSPLRREFTGLNWYPVDEAWRVTGKFEPSPDAARIVFETVLGDQQVMESAGFVTFEIEGRRLTLQAARSERRLFFVFRDATSGSETYPGGRFLYTDFPEGDRVELDFNRAYNPPCAFTPHSTCPLPPPQNRLPVAIRAGELKYK